MDLGASTLEQEPMETVQLQLGVRGQRVQDDVHIELAGCLRVHIVETGPQEKMLEALPAHEIQMMRWLDALGFLPENLCVEAVNAQATD